jgi:hypothetical protein
MKATKLFLLAAVVPMVVGSFAVSQARAVIATYKASAGPAANPDANLGTVNVWNVTLTSFDGSKNGSFQGDSAANGNGSNDGSLGAGGSAWALYANSGEQAFAGADVSALFGRNFGLVGDSISLDFDNGFIDTGRQVQIQLLDAFSSHQFTFRFEGGSSEYEAFDDGGLLDTDIPFTDNGFKLTLTITDSAGGYTLSVLNTQSPNPISKTFLSRTLDQGTSSISAIIIANASAGSGTPANVYFDNLTIAAAVPEASPMFAIPLAVAAAFFGSLGVRRCLRRAG